MSMCVLKCRIIVPTLLLRDYLINKALNSMCSIKWSENDFIGLELKICKKRQTAITNELSFVVSMVG